MCLYPKIIKNPKYEPNKKNGYTKEIPKDYRMKYIPIACGKCIECRKKKIREWTIRLQWEEKYTKTKGRFITLTFSEEALDELEQERQEPNEIAARAIKLFLKRWEKKFKKTLRHWLVTELGDEKTERLHLHGFIWTENLQDIQEIWNYGRIDIGTGVNEKGIRYCTKYVNKRDEKHEGFYGKIFASKGIGREFMKSETARRYKALGENAPQYIRTSEGQKIDIPIYWRNKLFTEEQREKIWCKLLDRQERYVMGDKVDISTKEGVILYGKMLEFQQRENERLGYEKQPWSKKKYDKARKMLTKC